MTSLGAEWTLSALVDLPPPKPTSAMWEGVGERSMPAKDSGIRRLERELQTRLHLYEMILTADYSALPDNVIGEIQRNRVLALSVLLHVHEFNGAAASARATLAEILDSGLEDLPDEVRTFVADTFLQLVLHSPVAHQRSIAANENAADLTLAPRSCRLLELAEIVSSAAPDSPQSTLARLQHVASGDDEAAVAALFLLAHTYHELQLPLEERDFLQRWLRELARTAKASPASVAASLSGRNDAMEASILSAATRLIVLLRASSSHAEIGRMADEFTTAGYGRLFGSLRAQRAREPGTSCVRVAREDLSEPQRIRAILAHCLTSGTHQAACIICPEDVSAEVEKFPISDFAACEVELLAMLAESVAKAGLRIVPEMVGEDLLASRRWVLCQDISEPTDALAIGLIPLQGEVSVVFARAVVFETILDQTKTEGWISSTARMLGRPFDGQKDRTVRDAVRRVAGQFAAGENSVTVVRW